MIKISLGNLDANLDYKSLDFKNLDQEIFFCLDTMDNLDKFQKLVSTDREISISKFGLDCQDPQA
jgi:hypothetical protein